MFADKNPNVVFSLDQIPCSEPARSYHRGSEPSDTLAPHANRNYQPQSTLESSRGGVVRLGHSPFTRGTLLLQYFIGIAHPDVRFQSPSHGGRFCCPAAAYHPPEETNQFQSPSHGGPFCWYTARLARPRRFPRLLGPGRNGAVSGGVGRSQWDHSLELSRCQ